MLKKKKDYKREVSESCISSSVSWIAFKSIAFRYRGLGSFISSHLFIHFLHVQIFQINSGEVLDEIRPQKLKAFKVPNKEHYVVLVSLLKRLDGPSSNGLEFLLGS